MTDRGRGHAVEPLTERQRDVLRTIARFRDATGEFPSVCYISRRLKVHHSTIQAHVEALFKKGWLHSPAPAGLRCAHVR